MSSKEDIKRYKAAKKALQDYSDAANKAGIHEETPEYQRLNQAVIDAEQHVSPWLR